MSFPVHIEHVLPENHTDSLTSRYDGVVPPMESETPDGPTDRPLLPGFHSIQERNVPFQSVVITDIDASAPQNELNAAAFEHVKKKGNGYLELTHDPNPINEFCNPELFPMIYPTLFPYAIGGPENHHRSDAVSLKYHAKHLFSLTDRRFQQHYSFLFIVFNILQRRAALLHTSLKVKRGRFDKLAETFATVQADAIHRVTERVARGDWNTCHSAEEQQVLNLMREVNVVTAHVAGSSASRVVGEMKLGHSW